MPTLNPTQSYENRLKAVKGHVPDYALDYAAKAASGESFAEGSLVSLNDSGEIVAGCGDADMPMFSLNGTADFDNAGDDGNVEGGGIGALVATGGFELYTTAFDTTETYLPNTKLTASTGDDAGNVEPSPTLYNDRIVVGVVSQGTPDDTQYGQDLLYFWPCFIPAVSMT